MWASMYSSDPVRGISQYIQTYASIHVEIVNIVHCKIILQWKVIETVTFFSSHVENWQNHRRTQQV